MRTILQTDCQQANRTASSGISSIQLSVAFPTLSPARSFHDLWRTTSPSSSILSAHTIVCSHHCLLTPPLLRGASFRSGQVIIIHAIWSTADSHSNTKQAQNPTSRGQRLIAFRPLLQQMRFHRSVLLSSCPLVLLSSCPPSEPSPAPTETIGNSWRIVNTFLTFAQINVAIVPTAEMILILCGGSAFQTLPSSDLES